MYTTASLQGARYYVARENAVNTQACEFKRLYKPLARWTALQCYRTQDILGYRNIRVVKHHVWDVCQNGQRRYEARSRSKKKKKNRLSKPFTSSDGDWLKTRV